MNPETLPTLLVLVAAAVSAVIWQAIRIPTVRRFAIRNAVRRPRETALVVLGSLLGTAIVTGSFIVGDTLDTSVRATAYMQLGPVDEIVTVPQKTDPAELERRIAALRDPRIDGVGSLVAVPASIAAGARGQRRGEPHAQLIEIDFAAARSFGGSAAITGIDGPTPSPGRVVITTDLADTLDAGVGEEIVCYVFRSKLRLTVDRILPRKGIAGYQTGFQTNSPNAFVTPGTIARVTRAGIPHGALPPQTTILISNRGGVEDGAPLSDAVAKVVTEAWEGKQSLRVEKVKQDRLASATEQGESFGRLFLGIGSFAVVAGILLLVNIFVMLAEERKAQLGMLRAVGLRRSDLVRSFVIEGAMYGILAGIFGAAAGVGVGWTIVKLAAPIFGGFGDYALDLIFSMTPASVAGGACVGFLISLATVLVTSVRISRINIIRAIRDLADPPPDRARPIAAVAGGMLVVAGSFWFLSGLGDVHAWASALLGPPLATAGVVPLARRFGARRTAVLAAASFCVLWGIFANTILGGQVFDEGQIFAFVFQGLLLTFSAVIFLSQSQEVLEGGLRRLAARRLSLRLAIAYPLARRFRTGLTLTMYSLVIFTMVFIAVLSGVFGGQVETVARKAGGGFNVLVAAGASNPPPASAIARFSGVESVSAQLYGPALFKTENVPVAKPWPVSGVGQDFVSGGPPALIKRAPGFSSDAAVWETLISDPRTAIIDDFFLQSGGGPQPHAIQPGESMIVSDPVTGTSARRKVIGVVQYDVALSGVFMSRQSVRQALPDRLAPARFYLSVPGSESHTASVAAGLQGRFIRNGVGAITFRRMVEDQQQIQIQFLRLMQGYLALGLLVGIAGLGVVMIRAVRERRRAIGVLRSLGFQPQQVRRALMLESTFIALEGIVVGTVLAIITASQLVASGQFGTGIQFGVPWVQLTILGASALAASLVATLSPAQQASRVPPAVALRVAD